MDSIWIKPVRNGLLTTLAVIVCTLIFIVITGYYPQSFSMFVVLPVGALLLGAGCGAGLFLTLYRMNEKPNRGHYLISFVLSIVGFLGIYYVAFLSAEGFSTFSEYVKMDIATRSTSFFFRGKTVLAPVENIELGSVWNLIDFGLEGLGFLIGGLLSGFFVIGDEYCDKCKVYKQKKTQLFEVDGDSLQDTVNHISQALSTGTFADYIKLQMDHSAAAPFYWADLIYCPSCYDSRIDFRFMRYVNAESSSDVPFTEVRKYSRHMEIEQGNQVKELLEADSMAKKNIS